MRVARFVLSFLLLFVSASHLNAQQTASTLQRDPQAVALAQQSLSAMGGAQALLLQDSVATGQAQIFRQDGTSTVFTITKKSKGTAMVRTELQRSEGKQVRIVNKGTAAIQMANGSVRSLLTNNTVAERVEHIPALSLLSDWANTNMELSYVGSDSVNGQPADVVSISYIPPGAQDPNFWRSTTRTLFYVDQATKFVSKIQYQNAAENNTNLTEKVEIFFSKYQVVSGVAVPFQQSTYSDGSLLSTIIFTSVAFNVGLASSDFNLPGGN
jgi:hypothetical protein